VSDRYPVVRANKNITSSLVGLGSDSGLGSTTDLTSSSGSNKTGLLTSGASSGHGRWVTNMLLVTTTVRMVDGVHSDTSNTGPSVSLGLVLPEGSTSLQEGLVGSLTTSDNTNHSSAITLDGLSNAGGKSDSRLGTILGVTDDNGGGTGGSGERGSITVLGLNIAHDSTFGHLVDGHDIADSEGSLLSTVEEHTSVHAFGGNEVLSALFVFVLVSEDNSGKRGTSTGIVHDVSHNSLNVTKEKVRVGFLARLQMSGNSCRRVNEFELTRFFLRNRRF